MRNKTKGHIVPCFESVRESAQRLRAEIIIVDNASGDGIGEFFHAELPEVI
jgi:glycosyltransferase involved in cell wall biosynthesis